MKKLTLIVLSATLMLASNAFAKAIGTEGGNGGDTLAIEFRMKADSVLKFLSSIKSDLIDLKSFENAIATTSIRLSDQTLELNGVPKEAINYPDRKLIVIHREAWNSSLDSVKTLLAVHEYLGIMRVDDSAYQISSMISSLLPKESKTICGKFKDNGDSFQIIDGVHNAYIAGDDNSRPDDPKDIIGHFYDDEPWGKSYCVTGAIEPYDRGGETAYMFTRLDSLMRAQVIVK